MKRTAPTFLSLLLLACASTEGHESTSGADGGGGGGRDPAPHLTQRERSSLAALSADPLLVPDDVSNRYADRDDAATFGKKLFFDASFSGALWEGDNNLPHSNGLGKVGEVGKVACSSCHTQTGSFGDDRSLGNGVHSVSLAAGWTLRRSPSLLDVAQAKLLMWDGSKDSLFAQVFGPIESKNEMNSSRLFFAQRLFQKYRAEYEAIFETTMPPLDDTSRFPPLTNATTGCQKISAGLEFECHGMPGDGAEYDGMDPLDQDAVTEVVVNAGKAIGAFERRLACGPGRFDAWVSGDELALSPAELRGASLFVGRAKCVGCHAGPFLSDQEFHNVGMMAKTVAVVILDADDPGASEGLPKALADPVNTKSAFSDGDDGRLPSSIPTKMLGAFRTPTLRCVAERPAFMHTGQMGSLEEVVEFFGSGGDPFGYPGKNELSPLDLSDREKADLVTFLRALNGVSYTR